MADYNAADPAIYGPINGVFLTLSQWQQWQHDEQARLNAAASDQFKQAQQTFGVQAPNPYAPFVTAVPLEHFNGDCNQPNRPGFGGWATFDDSIAWANKCTLSHSTAPAIPPTVGSGAGTRAPAAVPIATTGDSAAGARGGGLQAQASFGGGGGSGEPGTYCDEFPDDPLCDLWYGGGIVFGGGGGGTTVNQPVIIQQGLSNTDVHGLIDGALKTIWSAVVGAMDAIVLVAISGIQSAITALGNALKAAFSMLARLAGFILKALRSLLWGAVRGILFVLQDIRKLLKHLVTDILAPAIKGIVAMRDKLLDLYRRFMRPMLIIIQDVRRVLNILAIFHVPFAQKLDGVLADIERRLTAPLLLLLRMSNQLANWMNWMVTARYLLQKPIFLASLNAYKGESINLLANAMNTPASPATIAAAQAAVPVRTEQQITADLQAFLSTGGGPYAADIAAAGNAFTLALQSQA